MQRDRGIGRVEGERRGVASTMSAEIATTRWTLVLVARDGNDTEAHRALEYLCETYWSPLYAFARSLGHDPDTAQDLTQGFFSHLLEKEILQSVEPAKGRFRSFLLASFKHFIAHHRRREAALKRGGGTMTISMDLANVEVLLAENPIQGMTPDQVFEYRWGLAVLERAIERLRSEWSQAEARQRLFEGLQPHLTGQDPRVRFRDLGDELGMTETAVRGAMYRLRQRFGQLIRAEIGETVADPVDVDAEVRHLLAVIRPWEAKQE